MKICKGQEKTYNYYVSTAKEDKKVAEAWNYAEEFASIAEAAIDKKVALPNAFAQAYKAQEAKKANSALQNAAYTMLTKVWEYGDELEEYNLKAHDQNYDYLGR